MIKRLTEEEIKGHVYHECTRYGNRQELDEKVHVVPSAYGCR